MIRQYAAVLLMHLTQALDISYDQGTVPSAMEFSEITAEQLFDESSNFQLAQDDEENRETDEGSEDDNRTSNGNFMLAQAGLAVAGGGGVCRAAATKAGTRWCYGDSACLDEAVALCESGPDTCTWKANLKAWKEGKTCLEYP